MVSAYKCMSMLNLYVTSTKINNDFFSNSNLLVLDKLILNYVLTWRS